MSSFDAEERLMRRIVDGLAAWTTFHQAGHANAHYDEHLFYEPIRNIVEGRDWRAKQQASIRRTSKGLGNLSSVDFVIFRNPTSFRKAGLLFLEVKYFRGTRSSQNITKLRGDIDKLRPLRSQKLTCAALVKKCGEPCRFLLVIVRGDALVKTLKTASKDNPKVVKMLSRARTQKVKNVYCSKVGSHLKADYQWQVIAIGESQWPT